VAELAAADGRRNLRRIRNRMLRFALWVVLILGVPSLLLSGYISAGWALAFGHPSGVVATVTGSAPAAPSNACDQTSINVVWADQIGFHHGSFTVCRGGAHRFPPGKTVRVDVLSGDGSLTQAESRGSAIVGVVIESLVLLGAVLLLAGLGRLVIGLTVAGRRWSREPWLPGAPLAGRATPRSAGGQAVLFVPRAGLVPWPRPLASTRRPRTALDRSLLGEAGDQAREHGFDPDNALQLTTWRRKDGYLLTPGDQLWLAAPRRARGHRRTPYALIRASDHRVFWAFGPPHPGDNW
jgi:hypothetical protein